FHRVTGIGYIGSADLRQIPHFRSSRETPATLVTKRQPRMGEVDMAISTATQNIMQGGCERPAACVATAIRVWPQIGQSKFVMAKGFCRETGRRLFAPVLAD